MVVISVGFEVIHSEITNYENTSPGFTSWLDSVLMNTSGLYLKKENLNKLNCLHCFFLHAPSLCKLNYNPSTEGLFSMTGTNNATMVYAFAQNQFKSGKPLKAPEGTCQTHCQSSIETYCTPTPRVLSQQAYDVKITQILRKRTMSRSSAETTRQTDRQT